MDLGLAIFLFILFLLVLILLISLLTKYFSYRLRKKEIKNSEVYSQVDEVQMKGQINQNQNSEYKQFIVEPKQAKLQSYAHQTSQQKYNIEMTNLRTPLQREQNNLYGAHTLSHKLLTHQESTRSISSLKSFRPERIASNRSNISNGLQRLKTPQTIDIPENTYKFVSKLVLYNDEGLNITIKQINSLISKQNKIQQNKNIIKLRIKAGEDNFYDQLEFYGLNVEQYETFMFETEIKLPKMQEDKQYLYSLMIVLNQQKLEITTQKYLKILEQFHDNN